MRSLGGIAIQLLDVGHHLENLAKAAQEERKLELSDALSSLANLVVDCSIDLNDLHEAMLGRRLQEQREQVN